MALLYLVNNLKQYILELILYESLTISFHCFNPNLLLILVIQVILQQHTAFLQSHRLKTSNRHHCQPAELNKSSVQIPNVKPLVEADT